MSPSFRIKDVRVFTLAPKASAGTYFKPGENTGDDKPETKENKSTDKDPKAGERSNENKADPMKGDGADSKPSKGGPPSDGAKAGGPPKEGGEARPQDPKKNDQTAEKRDKQDNKGDSRATIPVIGMLPILGRLFSTPKQTFA